MLKMRKYFHIFLVGIFFAILTYITTYPMIVNIGNSIYGYPGDAFGAIWQLWRYEIVLSSSLPWDKIDFIASPFGVSLGLGLRNPIDYFAIVVTRLSNEVIAYNFVIALSFWLSSFFAYLVARKLWQNEWVAILTGIIYGFCPYITWRATQHRTLAHLEWMPLYLLSLFYLRRNRDIRSAILSGAALAVVLVFNYYYGFFMGVATAVFLVCWVGYSLNKRKLQVDWNSVGLVLLALFFSALLSLPWTWSILRTVFGDEPSASVIAQIIKRPYSSLFHLSARPWDYLLPAIDHPVLGGFSRAIYDSIGNLDLGISNYDIPGLWVNWFTQKGANLHERPVYLSYTAMVLAAFGLRKAYAQRGQAIQEKEGFIVLFFVILFFVSIWFSMPAFIPVGELVQNLWPAFPDWKIPTPSKYIYSILPMFRVYVRFGIVAILSIAVLAGFGMRELLMNINHNWKKVGVIALVFALVIFEYLHLPHNTSIPPVPAEYEWLSAKDENVIIAEYPRPYEYDLFYQRVHQMPMINAHGMNPILSKKIWPLIMDLSEVATVERLGALGVRYVLLHTADYFPPRPTDGRQWMRVSDPLTQAAPGLRLIKTTTTAQVFEVTDNSARMMVWPSPIVDATGPWLNDTNWKWEAPTQHFYLINASEQTIKVTLSATSPLGDGTFQVLSKDEGKDPALPLQWDNEQILLQNIVCPPGETIIEIKFSPSVVDGNILWSDLRADISEYMEED